MRAILEAAVRLQGRLKAGTVRSEMGQNIGLTNADIEALKQVRGTRPAEPVRFEGSCPAPMPSLG